MEGALRLDHKLVCRNSDAPSSSNPSLEGVLRYDSADLLKNCRPDVLCGQLHEAFLAPVLSLPLERGAASNRDRLKGMSGCLSGLSEGPLYRLLNSEGGRTYRAFP